MASTDELRALDKAHLWHPFTAQKDWAESDPIVIERGEGVYLFDTDGNRYLDLVGSLWCNVHGHRHPTIDRAIREQLERIAHCTMLGLTHPPAVELGRRLAELAPPGLTRVFYSDDGATAVEVALKMAFQYWRQKPDPEPRRSKFVALGAAYHGDTLGDVSIGGVDRFHAMFSPLLFPALRIPSPYCYRCPLGLEEATCGLACADELDTLLAAHPGEIAAVVVEPLVQGAAGIIVQPEGYLRRLREITHAHGTLLIADEVAVGFGKTGAMFACERVGLVPDFLCLAKGITGGYLPLAATLTNDTIYAAFFATAAEDKTFQHGHTYGGNPLGAAAALACLDVFRDERTIERLQPKIARLGARLREIASLSHVGDVRHHGLMAGVELVADKGSKASYPWARQVGNRVCRLARERGLFVRPIGDVIIIMPPLVVTEAQIDDALNIVLTCIREVTEGESA